MRESKIEKEVGQHAKALGWLGFKFSSPGNRGVPDRAYFRDGRTVLVEYKAPGKRPTKLQTRVIEEIRAQKITVAVIDGIETGKAFFDAISN